MGALSRPRGALGDRVVGVYGSGGAPWHHLAFAALNGAEVRVVRAEDLEAGRLEDLDVLIFPGGGATAMAGLLAPLGEVGAAAVRKWVERGGTYLSSCAGSVLPLALSGEADAAIPTARCLRMVEARLANTGDATLGGLASPGVGRIEVRLDRDHRFARDLPERVELVHYNGPFFDLAAGPELRPFAWPEGATEAFTPAEGFLPGEAAAAGPSTFERCIAASAATGLEARYGQGRVVLFGSHPEFGLGPLCLGWGEGARLLLAALGEAGSSSPELSDPKADGESWSVRPSDPETSPRELAVQAAESLSSLSQRFAELAECDPGGWATRGFAPEFHGRSPLETWSTEAKAAAEAAAAAAKGLSALAAAVGPADRPWFDDEPRPGQDFGAMGLRQLTREAQLMLDKASAALPRPARRPAHAYDLFGEHPFHLAVGSYLSAAGLTAGALLTVALLLARHDLAEPDIDRLLWLQTAA